MIYIFLILVTSTYCYSFSCGFCSSLTVAAVIYCMILHVRMYIELYIATLHTLFQGCNWLKQKWNIALPVPAEHIQNHIDIIWYHDHFLKMLMICWCFWPCAVLCNTWEAWEFAVLAGSLLSYRKCQIFRRRNQSGDTQGS